MTIESVTSFVATVGIPGAILAVLTIAMFMYMPVVGRYLKEFGESLKQSNEKIADAVSELQKHTVRNESRSVRVVDGQVELGRLILLSIPPENQAEAQKHIDALNRLKQEVQKP